MAGRPTIANVRAALLAAFDRALAGTGTVSTGYRQGVESGIKAIHEAGDPVDGNSLRWIEQVDRLLELVEYLWEPHDDPAGLAMVREQVQKAGDELRREDPSAIVPRLATAVQRAFPDIERAHQLLEMAAAWLGSAVAPTCALCGRAVPANPAAELCRSCAAMRAPADVPAEAPLLDVLRALRLYGDGGSERTAAELERAWRLRHLRVEKATCSRCQAVGVGVVGRISICFGCLAQTAR